MIDKASTISLGSIKAPESGSRKTLGVQEAGFEKDLAKGIESVNQSLIQADSMATRFMQGDKSIELHEVMISMEKADLSFRYMTQVRNKVLDAYQEIMRMQV